MLTKHSTNDGSEEWSIESAGYDLEADLLDPIIDEDERSQMARKHCPPLNAIVLEAHTSAYCAMYGEKQNKAFIVERC